MTVTAMDPRQAQSRLHEFTVIDVRTPGEYAGGHVPGALNIPLDQLDRALPDLRHAAGRGELLVVCASGARSEKACAQLAAQGIRAATLAGGTGAWAAQGHALDRPLACDVKTAWSMDRQVRLTAGSLVLLGLALGEFVHPAFRLLSAGVAGGLVFSAVTDTCGMAAMLGKLPYNRPGKADLDATLARLRGR
ncbi:rhodanese-like domain-containing protein [Streptomyces misionensis]|uniref:rhodanese-like domain-containing protein n=1 Tax=Streptomyces misionensis TaxID=67331 RepID=UPI0033C8224A